MFEARLEQGALFRKIVDSIKELVHDANFDCSANGFQLQAMDSSHVSLVAMFLRADGFEHYRCDKPHQMGMNLANLFKMMKCAGGDDILTMSSGDGSNEEGSDTVSFKFESPNEGRLSEFELKLMQIDSEHLGIPDSDYSAIVKMPSAEFQRICRDLATIGDNATILVTKDGIKFSTRGDIGKGEISIRHDPSVEKEEERTLVDLQEEPVELTFALRYFNQFCKATPLCNQVVLQMSKDLPIVVEYVISDIGHLRYYLAPKVEDEEEDES